MKKDIYRDLPNSAEIAEIFCKCSKEGKHLGEAQLQYLNLPNAEEIFTIIIEEDYALYWKCIPKILTFSNGLYLFKTYVERCFLLADIIEETLDTIFTLPNAEEFLEVYITNEGYIPKEYKEKLLNLPNGNKLLDLYNEIAQKSSNE